jgi:hypothetical protein
VKSPDPIPVPKKKKAKAPPQPKAAVPDQASVPKPVIKQAFISVQGARVHNLKNISVDIPRGKVVVITGLERKRKKLAWPSTRSMLKGSAATWRA